jgi:hypothetical protein
MGRWAWGAASLVALVACGDIWGFHDLTAGTQFEPVFDATASSAPDVTQETSPVDNDDAAEAEAVDGATDDGAPTDDAISAADAGDATVDAPPGDAADASIPEAATADAEVETGPEAAPPNDGAADAIAACQAICAGCCDPAGHCEPGNATGVCGVSGALCQTCANESCGLLTPTQCCKSNGTCGCEGLVGGCN